ncbi:RimK family alpha-L-glutamate ligase [Amycolatopsis sp. NPDC051758]|uniref:RimK family alpha-L-glutamate ligase n=1 Tax=Amycolatopsis sp. NPDC051758 TaxID=3363935 RepID=UPI0037A5B7BA
MISAAYAIIIGDLKDPHVEAVVEALPTSGLIVLDAESISSVLLSLDKSGMLLADVRGNTCRVSVDKQVRGWVRRLAPAGWDHGVVLGSHASAVLASRLALLASVLRDPTVKWLTAVDDLFAAENKIVQYRAALAVGIRVPDFIVDGASSKLGEKLGEPFVLKPLGPGNFVDSDGRQNVVFARSVRVDDLEEVDLLSAPFLAQRMVRTERHFRVVTVEDKVWVAELEAEELPMDWRAHAPAHHSFRGISGCSEIEGAATKLAATLRVGFSSQDWVLDHDGPAFLDLNPAGQWLFLPSATSEPATAALSEWLRVD